MRFNLAAIVKRFKPTRRKSITIRAIIPPSMFATDLYQAVYAKVMAAWEAGLPAIINAYARTVDARNNRLITDSVEDIMAAIAGLDDSLTRLILDLLPELKTWAVTVDRWHRGKWRGNVLTATGVDLSTMLLGGGDAVSVAETVAWNASLVKNVSDEAHQRIASIAFAGVNARKTAAQVAKEMNEAVDLGRARSKRIAGDQMRKLTSALDRERQHDAGITRFKYRSSHKKHFRRWHQARDGKLYEAETLKEVGGTDVIKTDDQPGIPPFCGCVRSAVLVLD